jgi:translation elongation factor EF-Tu-like GTPase
MPTSNDLNDLESQVKKSKISAASFKSKSSLGSGQEILNIHKTIGNLAGHVRKTVIRVGALEKIVNNQSKKITSLKNISKTQSERISGTNIGAKLPGGSADNLNKTIVKIADVVSSIAETLKAQKKTSGAASENERKRVEREKED